MLEFGGLDLDVDVCLCVLNCDVECLEFIALSLCLDSANEKTESIKKLNPF